MTGKSNTQEIYVTAYVEFRNNVSISVADVYQATVEALCHGKTDDRIQNKGIKAEFVGNPLQPYRDDCLVCSASLCFNPGTDFSSDVLKLSNEEMLHYAEKVMQESLSCSADGLYTTVYQNGRLVADVWGYATDGESTTVYDRAVYDAQNESISGRTISLIADDNHKGERFNIALPMILGYMTDQCREAITSEGSHYIENNDGACVIQRGATFDGILSAIKEAYEDHDTPSYIPLSNISSVQIANATLIVDAIKSYNIDAKDNAKPTQSP